MEPWQELLEGGGSPDEDGSYGSPLLHIARFLRQMGVFQGVDPSNLPPPASKDSVDQLPKTELSEDTEVKCPICLREMSSGDIQVKMPCSHEFHNECIFEWLSKTNSCPVCRFELPTDDKAYEEHRLRKKQEANREENVRTLHNSMYS